MTLAVDNPILNLRLPPAGALPAVRSRGHTAAQRWCEAVSNWGEMGRWAFDHCGAPGSVKAVLARRSS